MYERLIALIGENNLKKIENKKILLVGIGGVGGYALESLIRTGFKHVTIIDGDLIEESNLNRQIISNKENVGYSKTDIAVKRSLAINPACDIKAFDIFLTIDNFKDYVCEDYDYIIDACDDIKIKIELIKYAKEHNIKIISSLGTARKLDPQKLKIITLNKTFNDPLAKKLRYELKRENIPLNISVVWSEEDAVPVKEVLGSAIFVPASAGLLLVNYIFLDILKERASI